MPAPNRSATVTAICERHPEAFPKTDQNDAARLVLLRGVIIPALNVDDGGRWGYLTKTDQRQPDGSYKVPCDVLMDRETGWVVDCMTGDGACWINHEPPPPAWVWTAVAPVVAPPAPAPAPDASVSVWIGLPALASFDEVGTIVPQGDDVVAIDALGRVLSVQPNGTVEVRPPGTVGAYERATRDGGLLRYAGTGTPYWIAVQPR